MRIITAITLMLSAMSIAMCFDMAYDWVTTGYGLHPAAAAGLSIISATLAGAAIFVAYFEPADEFTQLKWPKIPKH